ncbi:MAG: transposase, partial [Leadbetterella sp.]
MLTFVFNMTRVKFTGVKALDFVYRFTTENDCLAYISNIKWADGYHCRKCNGVHYCQGKKPFSRRCIKCRYDESVTGLRQKTCWDFKWKLQQVMKSSKKYPLECEIHVDEFLIGGPESQKRGRSKSKKKLIILAVEKLDDGV